MMMMQGISCVWLVSLTEGCMKGLNVEINP